MGYVAAARKRSHQWCVFLTPKNSKAIRRMTGHCFLRTIKRGLTSYEFYYTNPKNGCSIDILLFKLKLA